jgi:hypothetical protein
VENLSGPLRPRNKTPFASQVERSHDRVDEEARSYPQECGVEDRRLHQDEVLRLVADQGQASQPRDLTAALTSDAVRINSARIIRVYTGAMASESVNSACASRIREKRLKLNGRRRRTTD